MWKTAIVATCLFGATVSAQPPVPTPPRLEAGAPPELQVLSVGPGQMFMELSISPAGEVTSVAALRTTGQRQVELFGTAVRRWRFKPATVTERRPDGSIWLKPVASKALVAAFLRSPTVIGPSLGELPKDVGSPSVEVALPVTVGEPTYAATSLEKGMVMVEALVDEKGVVTEAKVIETSSPAFGAAALAAARQWRFRPARVAGRIVSTYVYLIFGFPQPIYIKPKGR